MFFDDFFEYLDCRDWLTARGIEWVGMRCASGEWLLATGRGDLLTMRGLALRRKFDGDCLRFHYAPVFRRERKVS